MVITALTRNFWKLRLFRPLKMSTAQGFARVRISQFHIVLACFFLHSSGARITLEIYGELSERSKVRHSKFRRDLGISSPRKLLLIPGFQNSKSNTFMFSLLLFSPKDFASQKQAEIYGDVPKRLKGLHSKSSRRFGTPPWWNPLFFKAFRVLKRLEPLAFSPDFLSNLQGGNQGGNNLGAVSKWS